jgi:hypothetical protein
MPIAYELTDDDRSFMKAMLDRAMVTTKMEIDDNPLDDMYESNLAMVRAALQIQADKLTMTLGVELDGQHFEPVGQEAQDCARASELIEHIDATIAAGPAEGDQP